LEVNEKLNLISNTNDNDENCNNQGEDGESPTYTQKNIKLLEVKCLGYSQKLFFFQFFFLTLSTNLQKLCKKTQT
jgi:hypothetical protein